MTVLTVKNTEIKIKFSEEVEGTYIVDVAVGDTAFQVNCQGGMTHDCKLSKYLTCSNESGGDIGDCGLADYLKDDLGLSDDEYEMVVDAIEAEAQEQVSIVTVVDYINEKLDNEFELEKVLAGACYANNCSLCKYTAFDGAIVVVAEDGNENVPDEIVQDYRVFSDHKEYSKWFDEATKGHQGHWSGDYSLALMLRRAL